MNDYSSVSKVIRYTPIAKVSLLRLDFLNIKRTEIKIVYLFIYLFIYITHLLMIVTMNVSD